MTLRALNLSVLFTMLTLAGCNKNIDQPAEGSNTAIQEPVKAEAAYNFTSLKESDFLNQSILINDEKTYRGIRFHDYAVGTKLIGAASIDSIQKVDNHTLALASSRPLINQKAGLYGVLANKANFDGNLVVLVFDPKLQARVIEGDIIAIKGTVAPSDVFTYTNPTTNQIEELPIIYVHFYQAGELSIQGINDYLKKQSSEIPNIIQDKILQYEKLNDSCRGGSGDDPKTIESCEARDSLYGEIKNGGWCWGSENENASGSDLNWLPCAEDRYK
ncbi:TPA: hypothetical protein NOZ40_000755 [Acinetobacter baumannii]|uniref:hypothetical protein n=1 Tax=Acinetobacter baumannii TaxID=470 RepID=UPI000DE65D9F|nr:hypothetical protein [Acinetobacter baumannii]SSM54474.1 Uncharacterised protein [Acinetobacter baumannii]SSM54487.1 Uncharacterised protein [Acinetobacter baumannii]SSM90860.1 Uncharacterised protein [Acinetobacter baumannii]SSN35469.1 Uncharacterised protein [Acinetobacter baumannii]HCI3536406.1 hypothetical protein [Acinetobacter baumannii]